jgi:hypothetical protein
VTALTRQTLLWMIPLNLLLVAWVWFGRVLFGVGGWFLLIYAVTIVPVLLAGHLVSTIVAYLQPGRPRRLTPAQAVAQLVVWAGMLVFGLSSVDFGDTEDSDMSPITQVFGRNQATLDLSWTLMTASALVVVVAWVTLLVLLVAGRRRGE